MRIGILGGTFDPIHYGHLLVAEQAREQIELDQVWFLLSARPPHKVEHAITPFERRADMVTLAIAGQEHHFRLEPIENERPGLSYTADTLDALAELHPAHEWFLILGADSVRDLPIWHEPQRIVNRAAIVQAGRPGFEPCSAVELARSLQMPPEDVRMLTIEVPLMELASRDMRRRVSEGKSLLYQTPRSVEVYIRERKLYR